MNNIYFAIFIIVTYIYYVYNKTNNSKIEGFALVKTKGFNNENHFVRNDFNNTKEAADLMAHIKQKINMLVEYLNIQYPDNIGVKNINERLDLDNMMEAKHEDDSTSYTINKGEEIHICMREKNEDKILHDINTMMFVILHEMAHIMSNSIGHNKEFKDNFILLLKTASKINLYKEINYHKHPQSYCGLKINTTPLKSSNNDI